MKKQNTVAKIALLISVFSAQWSVQADDKLTAILNNLEPKLFAPNIVSTNQFDYGSSLSPDGKKFAFVRALARFSHSALVITHKQGGSWQTPTLMPFSGEFHDTNPYFSKDSNTFYFTSRRPIEGSDKGIFKMWQVNFDGDKFGQPELVPGKINGDHNVIYPTVHTNKDIYFSSVIKGSKGGMDLFISKYHPQGYLAPTEISELNSTASDADPEVSTDGKVLFYTSMRAGGLGHYDLHVSVKQKDGKWGEPINLGDKINSRRMDSDPILSADGNTLFFSSDKNPEVKAVKNYNELLKRQESIHNGLMNIYSVDITELNSYLRNNI
ncbi:PD40 domain-containing protein [Pseudoalteromonas luteoviolacea]|uniref:PD40 domain-containing protein n=1 Tax=Pseudoalteromonas luteoviolacea TaxID=43657 RepID=UPI001B39E782|nr:PD40 domain-containing protein [Pseudoalteromonas luteoviolacea]MBQ4880297.1 PD40 domain-containing protein [Pseudoalteromonas luteoviolacea]MBQ4909358.1 PD40 domain-containing protein [Pseudoalteromonas luteoviolacea]